MPCLIGHFSQKSPIISGSFTENDLQLKASYQSSSPNTLREPAGCTLLITYLYLIVVCERKMKKG